MSTIPRIFHFLYFLLLFVFLCCCSNFIGFGSTRCIDFGCKHLFIAEIDSSTGAAKNLTDVPDNIFGERIDLIHAEADPARYFLVYANTRLDRVLSSVEKNVGGVLRDIGAVDEALVVTYDMDTQNFAVTNVEDKIKAVYSTCYWPGDYLYGLGWMPDDTPFTLTAFAMSKNDLRVDAMVQLPGSYIMMPDCALNPDTNKLYFYSRNVGQIPHTLTIWEVDVEEYDYVSWNINGSIWSQPYLFQYNSEDGNMYALVGDGSLTTWLVQFDPTATDTNRLFIKIKELPDQLLESYVISYDMESHEFVYLNTMGELVSVSNKTFERKKIFGIPENTLRRMSFLHK